MSHPNLVIDALNLRLPHGLAHRADAIARRVGRELARLPLQHDAEIPRLQLPAIKAHGGEADSVIARRIAGAIHQQINRSGVTHGAD